MYHQYLMLKPAMYKTAAKPGKTLTAFFFPTRFTLLLIHVKTRWKHVLENSFQSPDIFCCVKEEPVQMSKTSQQNTATDANGVSVIHTQAHTSGLQQVPQLVPVSPGGGGKAVPPSKQGKKNSFVDRNSDEYRQRRERNNMAVKKSRLKSKQKAQDTLQRVTQLKEENERLEAKIKLLTKELSVLKDLFLEHAHNLADNVQPVGTETTTTNPENSGQ